MYVWYVSMDKSCGCIFVPIVCGMMEIKRYNTVIGLDSCKPLVGRHFFIVTELVFGETFSLEISFHYFWSKMAKVALANAVRSKFLLKCQIFLYFFCCCCSEERILPRIHSELPVFLWLRFYCTPNREERHGLE